MIKYKDLSGWLQTIVILSWILVSLSGLAFIAGFMGWW